MQSKAKNSHMNLQLSLNPVYYAIICTMMACISCTVEDLDDSPEKAEINSPYATTAENISSSSSRSNAEEQNLLENGSLEEWSSLWTPEMPKGWSLPSNEYVRQNRTIVYEGNSSAKMQSQESGKTARLEQKIPLSSQNKIRIRFHYYVEQWKSKGARTYCYFRTREAESSNLSTDDLKAFYDDKTYYIIRGGGYGLTYFPHKLNIWQVFDETIEVPPTANFFVFGINSYYGTTIYVDDCYVIDATELTPTGIRDVSL